MKIKKGFLLCPVMGKTMAISTGELEKEFPGMIKMNEPSTDIWKWIEAGKELDEIYSLYATTYGIDAAQAKDEVDGVVKMMNDAGVLE
ncbi:MAG: PqqD family protein [Paludibacteraceae bacterium]|nr:PqqD family protein [Paludibacteraceae bacterium]